MTHTASATSSRSIFRRPCIRGALLLALCAVQFFLFLGNRDLWYPDEPDIGEPAREMLLRGDWVVPTLNGSWWIDYPPMVYWLCMIVCTLFGAISEFALRIPSALSATALILAVCRFVSVRQSAAAGICAGLVLATSPQFAWQAVNVHPDMVFACFQGIGLFACVAAADRTGWRWLALHVAGFLCFAIAFLTKGPLGLLLPGFVLSLWLLSYRQWGRWLTLAPLAVVTLAAVLPWYLALGERIGHANVWHHFWAQNFARFTSGQRGHLQPWYYFLKMIWADFGLWTPPLVALIVIKWRQLWADRWQRLALLWFLGMFIFFTIATTKRQVYLLPAYPAAAILIGSWLGRCIDHRSQPAEFLKTTLWLRYLTILVTVFGIAIAVAGALAFALGPSITQRVAGDRPELLSIAIALRPSFIVCACTALLVTIVALAGLRLRSAGLQAAGVIGLNVALWLVTVAMILPVLNPAKSYRPKSEWLASRLAPGAELGFFYPGKKSIKYTGFLFYTGAPLRMLDTAEDLAVFLADSPRSLAVVGVKPGKGIAVDPRFAPRILDQFRIGSTSWMVFGGDRQEPVTTSQ